MRVKSKDAINEKFEATLPPELREKLQVDKQAQKMMGHGEVNTVIISDEDIPYDSDAFGGIISLATLYFTAQRTTQAIIDNGANIAFGITVDVFRLEQKPCFRVMAKGFGIPNQTCATCGELVPDSN